MYKYILQSAGNINWMAIFALFTFLFIFILGVVLAFSKNKEELNHYASLPLEDNQKV